MSKFFNHTPQMSSSTNQVENLAQEVNDGFLEIESLVSSSNNMNTSIDSSIGSLDNSYIKDYRPNNGLILNYEQHLYFPTNSQSASLDLNPSLNSNDLNSVSISNLINPSTNYTYKTSGLLQNQFDFTFVDKKVVFGGIVEDDLVITYRGYNATDNNTEGFDLKYNVLRIKQPDNSEISEFNTTSNGSNSYSITGYNLKALCSTHIKSIIDNTPEDILKYIAIYTTTGDRIETTQINVTNSVLSFTTEDSVPSKVKVYAANSSLSVLIEHLYRLFYNHDHSSNGGNNVDHSSLLNLYSNTYDVNGSPVITYQNSNKKNYDHPQYLNREGFINDSSVYNNAMLGDLLLSSTTSAGSYNNIDADSHRLVFGNYDSGHKIYYSNADDCLLLNSMSKNGVKLITAKNKVNLSINDHSFVDVRNASNLEYLQLSVQSTVKNGEELGLFKIVRKKTTVVDGVDVVTDDDTAQLEVNSMVVANAQINKELNIQNNSKISFGDPAYFEIIKEDDGLHFKENVEEGSTSLGLGVYFDTKMYAENATIDTLNSKEIILTNTQKIVYGNKTDNVYTQYINYNSNQLSIKSNVGVNFKNNGRLTGINLDNRQYIYTSTPQGSYVESALENTDLYFETKRDVYFIKTGYNFVQGSTNLQSVPKSDIYSNISNANNFNTLFDSKGTNGYILDSNNKLFVQKDLQSNLSTIIKANNGVVIANTYSIDPNTLNATITYGKIKALEYYAEGNKNTSAGFYGNVNIPIDCKITINGLADFASDITFIKNATFEGNATFTRLKTPVAEISNLTGPVNSKLDVTINTTFGLPVIFDNRTSFTNDATFVKISAEEAIINKISGPIVFNAGATFASNVNFNSGVSFSGDASFVKATIAAASLTTVITNTQFKGNPSFEGKTFFIGDVEANKVTVTNLTTTSLTVNGTVNFKDKVTAIDLEVSDEFRFKSMLQTDSSIQSTFTGPLTFLNNLEVSSNKYILIGNKDIRGTRDTVGAYLTDTELKLGNNSSIKATKIFTNKGLPTGGNSDVIGGFAFDTKQGQSDGDTGFFATNNGTGYSGDDLVFMIDGDEKGRITKQGLNLKTDNLAGKGKVLVTVDMLVDKVSDMNTTVMESIYPVGSIYLTTVDANPKTLLNWSSSVWRRYSIGRTMIGAEGPTASEKIDTNLNKPSGLNLTASGAKYGDYVCTLLPNQLPVGVGKYLRATMATSGDLSIGNIDGNGGIRYSVWENPSSGVGEGKPHDITQPSIVTFIWERVG